jgi:hypothetical protein
VFDLLMGVIGTSCQLCNLPVNHDHYVPSESLGMLKIYRSRSPAGGHDWEPGERVVQFTAEHAWLCDAVALLHDGRVVAGPVEDGGLDAEGKSYYVDDADDGYAYHRVCHELVGGERVTSIHTHAWAQVQTYAGQLFEYQDLIDHGKAWMLVDPRTDSDDGRRSRARIAAIREQARLRPVRRPATVAEILASDRGWRGSMLRTDHVPRHILRYRDNVHPELDCAAYPALVWAMKEYGEGMPDPATLAELEAYEVALKAAVERDAAAILIMTTIGDGQAQFIIQARDEAATVAAITALPAGARSKPVDFDNEADPAWKVYFTTMSPRARR